MESFNLSLKEESLKKGFNKIGVAFSREIFNELTAVVESQKGSRTETYLYKGTVVLKIHFIFSYASITVHYEL